ncbi:NAD(P)H-dependent flavin oxidoreductase [Phytohabitans flavus]|uniref:NAD(P)H-dependent flavin oxidoreductase n=1 Tax=Phytohabitans flavus TaxID=1076124 RepID=UPI0036384E61
MTTGLRTALTDRLGITVPVVQAPVGSAAAPELAAAVSEAGGLGMLALTWHRSDEARDQIREVRRRTSRPFGVNLVLDFPVADTLAVCLDEAVPVVSTFWGDPAPASQLIREAGALHMHTVGSVTEARHAAGCGVDVIVAQGWEAGGHVRGTTTTMVLVPSVIDAVGSIPVVAAGGISDGRGIAAALALGAQGVWLGTRFLATHEASAHRLYQDRLVASGATDTALTRCFDGGWPDAPHRALGNPTLRRWESAGSSRTWAPRRGRRRGRRRRRPHPSPVRGHDPRPRHDRRPGGDGPLRRPVGRARPRCPPRRCARPRPHDACHRRHSADAWYHVSRIVAPATVARAADGAVQVRRSGRAARPACRGGCCCRSGVCRP